MHFSIVFLTCLGMSSCEFVLGPIHFGPIASPSAKNISNNTSTILNTSSTSENNNSYDSDNANRNNQVTGQITKGHSKSTFNIGRLDDSPERNEIRRAPRNNDIRPTYYPHRHQSHQPQFDRSSSNQPLPFQSEDEQNENFYQQPHQSYQLQFDRPPYNQPLPFQSEDEQNENSYQQPHQSYQLQFDRPPYNQPLPFQSEDEQNENSYQQPHQSYQLQFDRPPYNQPLPFQSEVGPNENFLHHSDNRTALVDVLHHFNPLGMIHNNFMGMI